MSCSDGCPAVLARPKRRYTHFPPRSRCPTRNRWHQQNLISILKRISVSAQESNVLFVDVHVQKAPSPASFIPQMLLQIRKLLIERREQCSQVRRRTFDLPGP